MSIFSNLDGFRDRFWYWSGKSGTRYIHSIYSPDACPPLPGAIYVTVQKLANGKRVAVEVGRFCEDWGYVQGLIDDHRVGFCDIDEIHVHLLAKSDDNADEVVKDIAGAIGPHPVFTGFHQDISPAPAPTWQPGLFDQLLGQCAIEGSCDAVYETSRGPSDASALASA